MSGEKILSPAQKKALRQGALLAASAGGVGLLFYGMRLLMPLWLFWGVWCFYFAAALAFTAWMAWDTRRVEKERLRMVTESAAVIAQLMPEIHNLMASMQIAQKDRAELWYRVTGRQYPGKVS
jgi:hypothetical protein